MEPITSMLWPLAMATVPILRIGANANNRGLPGARGRELTARGFRLTCALRRRLPRPCCRGRRCSRAMLRTSGSDCGYSRARKAISPSRSLQRRSKFLPEWRADTSTRTCIVALAGVGHLQHAHAAVPFRRRLAQPLRLGAQRRHRHARSRAYRNTVPMICEPVRVQFSNGFSMNHCSGMTRRRSSQMLQHHVGAGDLLDAAPLALDDQHVVDADRLRQRDLQARRSGC